MKTISIMLFVIIVAFFLIASNITTHSMITSAYAKKHRTGNFGSVSSSGQSKSSIDQSTTKKGHKNRGSAGGGGSSNGGGTPSTETSPATGGGTPSTIIPQPTTPLITNCPDGSTPDSNGKCAPATPYLQ